jgi:hypothetical protein
VFAGVRASYPTIKPRKGWAHEPADAPIGPGLTEDNLPPRQAIVPPQQPDVGPRPVEVPSRPAVEAVPYPDVPLQPVQSRPAPSADLPPRSPDIRATPPSASPPLETAAPQPSPPDRDNGAFSALTRIPLLRPDPPPNGAPPAPAYAGREIRDLRHLHWALHSLHSKTACAASQISRPNEKRRVE